MKINENFSLLRSNYLFSTMSRKIKDYKIAHPEAAMSRVPCPRRA